MLTDDMQLISVDDHVVEPPTVWTDRLPQKYKDLGPRIVEDHEAPATSGMKAGNERAQVWLYEDRAYPTPGLGATAGKPRTEFGNDPVRYEQMRAGCYDPVARVEDMDLDGIQAGLSFPTFPRFSGTTFLEGEDKELALLCVQAYNDWMIDDWCGTAPDRLIPLVLVPLWDPHLAAEEIQRTAARGARAVTFPENPAKLGLPSFHTEHWDPFWAACQDADMPVCMHFGTSGTYPQTAEDAPFAVTISIMGCNSMFTLHDLLFSPVFFRFPRLKVALSEGGIGWIPLNLEKADRTWELHQYHALPTAFEHNIRPSELFERNIWGCFIEDEVGIANRHRIGIHKIMWECDYPHSDTNWPHAREQLSEALADVPDDEAQRIVELNARELFSFPRETANISSDAEVILS